MSSLEKNDNFHTRLGVLKKRGENADGKPIFVQKGVDLQLGLDVAVACLSGRIDQVIFIAGDGDFLPASNFARDAMVRVVLAHGDRKTYDYNLWESADERIFLDSAFFDMIRLS